MLTNSAALRLIIAAVMTTWILTASADRLVTGNASMPSVRSIGDLSALNGVWRSRGYGWLWTVKDGRIRIYDQSGAYCIPTKKTQEIGNFAEGLQVGDDGRTIRLTLEDSTYAFVFDRIDALPGACARLISKT